MGVWRRFIKWLVAAFVIGGVSTHAAYTASKTRVQEKVNPNKRTRSRKPLRTEFELEFIKDDPYETLTKPGSCITRLFPNIEEEKTFFTKKSTGKDSDKLTITTKDALEDNNEKNPPEFGCYMYYYDKLKYETRYEIAIRGQTDGWVWMGVVDKMQDPYSQYYKTWYREFLLEKYEKIWEITLGQEGEINSQPKQSGYTFSLAIHSFHDAFKDVKWIYKNKHCSSQRTMCGGTEYKLLKAGYWTPDEKNSKYQLANITKDVGRQITRWSGEKNHKLIHQGRKRIYKDYEWYENVDHLKDTPLIKLDNKKAAWAKGNWKDLLSLCETKDPKTYDIPYKVLCQF